MALSAKGLRDFYIVSQSYFYIKLNVKANVTCKCLFKKLSKYISVFVWYKTHFCKNSIHFPDNFVFNIYFFVIFNFIFSANN